MDDPVTRQAVRQSYDMYNGDLYDKVDIDNSIWLSMQNVNMEVITFHRKNYEVERATIAIQQSEVAAAAAVAAAYDAQAWNKMAVNLLMIACFCHLGNGVVANNNELNLVFNDFPGNIQGEFDNPPVDNDEDLNVFVNDLLINNQVNVAENVNNHPGLPGNNQPNGFVNDVPGNHPMNPDENDNQPNGL